MKLMWLLLFFMSGTAALSQETKTDTLWIESTAVQVRQSGYGTNAADVVFLNVHENESTSVKAAEQYLEDKDGKLLSIHQSGKRFLSFRLKTTTFQFDPNRIFSEKGRVATLKANNKTYLPAAEKKVEEFAGQLLSNIKDAK